ncbi:hypothetical protein L3V31_21665 [Vibrio sp. J1-1]|uniref:hypothetical protein n=1 Tax=Vibrio sp. J1-1 TaxID=2912251 RepID=UPI001F45C2EA|nr:hypothetical protein [Vibrio sp. J1-1]MCF7484289.1 hypothetical protein [Vibrio sp. J1-1]
MFVVKHNKQFNSDSQRLALSLWVEFSVYGAVVNFSVYAAHTLIGRYVYGRKHHQMVFKMKLIKKEKAKLEEGISELERRRLEWSKQAKPTILSVSDEYAKNANEAGFPYRLIVNVGSEDLNYQTVQIGFGINSTGILTKERQSSGDQVNEIQRKIIEKGCALVFPNLHLVRSWFYCTLISRKYIAALKLT